MPKYKLGAETKLAAVRFKGRNITHDECVELGKNDAAALRKAGYDLETCKKVKTEPEEGKVEDTGEDNAMQEEGVEAEGEAEGEAEVDEE